MDRFPSVLICILVRKYLRVILSDKGSENQENQYVQKGKWMVAKEYQRRNWQMRRKPGKTDTSMKPVKLDKARSIETVKWWKSSETEVQ